MKNNTFTIRFPCLSLHGYTKCLSVHSSDLIKNILFVLKQLPDHQFAKILLTLITKLLNFYMSFQINQATIYTAKNAAN